MFAHELGVGVIALAWFFGSLLLAVKLIESFPKAPAWLVFVGCYAVTGFLASFLI